MKQLENEEEQDSKVVDVLVRQASCNRDPRIKGSWFSIGFPLGGLLWIRVHQHNLLGTKSRSSLADPADVPAFSGCEEMACQASRGVLEASLNRTEDPCKDLCRFVCDGWNHHYHLSADDTQDAVYSHALNTVRWLWIDETNGEFISSDSWSVEKKVVGFARSCMYSAESTLAVARSCMYSAESTLADNEEIHG